MVGKLKKVLVTLVAATVGFIGGGLAIMTPAQAAYADCPGAKVCMWLHSNATGTMWSASIGDINQWNGVRLPAWANNTTSSWYNRSSFAVQLFDSHYCMADSNYPWWRTLAAGQQATGQGSDWNDRISSVKQSNQPQVQSCTYH